MKQVDFAAFYKVDIGTIESDKNTWSTSEETLKNLLTSYFPGNYKLKCNSPQTIVYAQHDSFNLSRNALQLFFLIVSDYPVLMALHTHTFKQFFTW